MRLYDPPERAIICLTTVQAAAQSPVGEPMPYMERPVCVVARQRCTYVLELQQIDSSHTVFNGRYAQKPVDSLREPGGIICR
jgi:hypothetical protein